MIKYQKMHGNGNDFLMINSLETGFQPKKSFIKIVGSGQASVCSSEKLRASINGTADVTYVGKPKEVDITTWLGDKKHQYSVGHSSINSNK